MADAVDSASLTIIKDAQPNDPQDFHFTIDAPNDLDAAFDLDDDADGDPAQHDELQRASGRDHRRRGQHRRRLDADRPHLSPETASRSAHRAGTGTTLTLADNDVVTCTFTNSRESSLEVDKYWVINGGTPVQEGSEPAHLGLGAQLTVNGGNQPWDTSITGFLQGAGVTLNESVTFGNPLCDWAGATHGLVTEDNGQAPAERELCRTPTSSAAARTTTRSPTP